MHKTEVVHFIVVVKIQVIRVFLISVTNPTERSILKNLSSFENDTCIQNMFRPENSLDYSLSYQSQESSDAKVYTVEILKE